MIQLQDPRRQRTLRAAALAVAVVGALWTAALMLTGGVDVTVYGVRLTSRNPFRLGIITVLATGLYLLMGGLDRVEAGRRAGRWWLQDRTIVGALALAVLVMALKWSTYGVGGSDSFGYASQADLWLKGFPIVTQPWAMEVPWPTGEESFIPLAYKAIPGTGSMVATYPSGLAFVMAAFKLVAGDCAIYWVVPIFAVLFVTATYGIGRRLGSSTVGLTAAWLTATSPVFLFMMMAPVSDVAASSCLAMAFFLVLGPGLRNAFAAGLAGGLGSMIRPNLAPMTALLVLWHVIEAWREKGDARRRRIQQAAAVIAGLLPGALALASVNTALYGSPLRLGYARASDYYSWSHVAPNIVNYFGWFVETQTVVAVCGLVLLFLPFRQLWPPPASRSFVAVMAVFVFGVWAQYWLFLVFEVWWYLRMLLPSWPFIMVGTGALAALAMRSGRPVIRIAIIVAIFFLGVRGVIVARDRAAFIVWRDEMRYGAAAMHARRLTAENSVVLTLQHSGSMRYYGGRVTLRWDYLPADWLDRAVAWMRERGVHSYALLDAAELPPFRERFATQRTLVTLGRPIFVYDGKVRLYDLVESSEPAPKVEVIAETATGAHCIPPAPQPTLSFAAPR